MSDNGLVFQVQLVAALLIVLIVYHHVGYPLLLRLLARLGNRRRKQLNVQLRHFRQCVGDRRVPSIHLFIPVYNEADHIHDKVTSLAWLDYPRDKLTVTLLFDGCSDDSVERARLARSEIYAEKRKRYGEQFQLFVCLGLGFLLIEMMIPGCVRKTAENA